MEGIEVCGRCGSRFYTGIGCEGCRQIAKDRTSRIEARFERFVEANLKSGCDSVAYWDDFPALWEIAEKAESFLESKRAEVKDGK